MEVSFYLKRPDSKTTALFARVSYNGHQLKYYLPEKIDPKFWNKETHRAKETKKFREFPEFNTRLDNIASDIKSVYRKFLNDHNGLAPSDATFKELLDKKIKNAHSEKKKKVTFFEFFEDMINQTRNGSRLSAKSGKPFSKNTVKAYVTTQNNLTEYNSKLLRKIDFPSFDLDFYNDYLEFLIKEKKFTTNTVGKHIKILKTILNEATERGINTSLSFKSKRFITTKENTDNIFLTENELQELEKLDLSEKLKLDRVRDLFLIGCYTGLRFSDFSVIKPEHIEDGFIRITQFKTKDPVVVPIHATVEKILNKYRGVLPRSISNQKFNDFLKELGQLVPEGKNEAVLSKSVTKKVTKGGIEVITVCKKWELLTTHTARRSFATNEYLAGTPAITIKAITGHRTEQAFLKYIKLTPSDHAKLLKLHWDNRALIKAL